MYKDFTKYEIYEDGRIWSYKTNKFLKPYLDKDGYQRVWLSNNDGKMKQYQVHRVVYEAVTRNPIPDGMQVNHIDEDKTNNHINNLNLMTCKENNNWGTRNVRLGKAISEANTNNPKRSKAVGAYKDGELVMTFPSTNEAHRVGFKKSNVSKCCNGKLPHYKGYVWKYI